MGPLATTIYPKKKNDWRISKIGEFFFTWDIISTGDFCPKSIFFFGNCNGYD